MSPQSSTTARSIPPGGIAATLVVMTAIVFCQIVGFGWVNWDDDVNVTENPGLNPVTPASIAHFWKSPYEGLYIPVSYTLYAAEAILARALFAGESLDPRPFHAVSLALHSLCVLLMWRILSTRVANGWAAAAGATLFAVHPLQVESVAWISEQRGLASVALCLAAICLSCGTGAEKPRRGWAAGLFALAILAKPQAVVAPLLLALLDGDGSWRSIGQSLRRRWPWLVIAAIISVITKVQQSNEWSWEGADVVAWQRPLVAGDAICFYAGKFLVPSGLCLDYGRIPDRVLSDPVLCLRATLAVVVVGGVAVLPLLKAIRVPVMLVVVGLLPVLGLVPFTFQGFSTVADRYAYLPMLGAGVGIAQATAGIRPRYRKAAAVGLVLWLLSLTVTTLGQLPAWRDSEALNTQILRVNPRSAGGRLGLATAWLEDGRIQEAADELRAAVAANPEYVKARYELASTLHTLGRREEAEEHYRAAIRLRPGWTYAHNDLGILLAEQGRLEEAVVHFREAVSLRPDLPAQRLNLERAEAALKAGSGGKKP